MASHGSIHQNEQLPPLCSKRGKTRLRLLNMKILATVALAALHEVGALNFHRVPVLSSKFGTTKETCCAICLDTPSRSTTTLVCGHEFCETCIDQWNKPCPVCRHEPEALFAERNGEFTALFIDLGRVPLLLRDIELLSRHPAVVRNLKIQTYVNFPITLSAGVQKQLVQALSKMKNLTELGLDGIRIDEEFSKALAGALRNKRLVVLGVRDAGLSSSGAQNLLQSQLPVAENPAAACDWLQPFVNILLPIGTPRVENSSFLDTAIEGPSQPALEWLYLEKNEILTFGDSLEKFKLKGLYLKNNPILDLPEDLSTAIKTLHPAREGTFTRRVSTIRY